MNWDLKVKLKFNDLILILLTDSLWKSVEFALKIVFEIRKYLLTVA